MNENLPTKIEDVVREKMKTILGEIIPDEQWDAMIRREHEKFIREELPKLIRTELIDKYKAYIKEMLEKEEWREQWDNGCSMASEKIKELIVAAAPLVLANLIGGSMQQVLYHFQQNIQNMPRY